jgi:hypothetical protein
MSFDAQINFRSTAGYVTDGEGQTYCTANGYPTVRAGLTFGWESGDSASYRRDRSTAYDVRLAGINHRPNTGTQHVFRLDLPSPGKYAVGLAIGDATYLQEYQYLQVLDDSTPRITIDEPSGTGIAHFLDAAGNDHVAADWPDSHGVVAVEFGSAILRLVLGSPSSQDGSSTLAHLRVVQAEPVNGAIVQQVVSPIITTNFVR